ncbi:MAG: hypothetical protein NHG36_14340, partial [Chromatiaceae bacterium]|nr:hypothetical protein [Candidatus Thioaporhodococcus sediminis]
MLTQGLFDSTLMVENLVMMQQPYFVTFAAILALSSMTIHAASDCKGLDEKACAANSACTWTKGYTRSDGKEVAAYCKAKSGSKASSSTSAPASAPVAAPAVAPAPAQVPAQVPA